MKIQSKMTCFAIAALLFSGCSSNEEATNNKSLNEQFTLIQESVGEDFNASMELTKEEALSKYGIANEDVEEMKANIAMISMHVDNVVLVRAKDGKAENVKQALEAYRQTQIDDSLQYPMNKGIIQGSIVKQNGNDVYFIMLGVYDDAFMELDEAAQVEAALKQNEEVYNKLI